VHCGGRGVNRPCFSFLLDILHSHGCTHAPPAILAASFGVNDEWVVSRADTERVTHMLEAERAAAVASAASAAAALDGNCDCPTGMPACSAEVRGDCDGARTPDEIAAAALEKRALEILEREGAVFDLPQVCALIGTTTSPRGGARGTRYAL